MVLVSYKSGYVETVRKVYFINVIMKSYKEEIYTYLYL